MHTWWRQCTRTQPICLFTRNIKQTFQIYQTFTRITLAPTLSPCTHPHLSLSISQTPAKAILHNSEFIFFFFWQLGVWKWNWQNSKHPSLFVCMHSLLYTHLCFHVMLRTRTLIQEGVKWLWPIKYFYDYNIVCGCVWVYIQV